ncbi:MAG: heme ABC exporter ATP-binding protein CcmA [Pseudomonadota bacterium]
MVATSHNTDAFDQAPSPLKVDRLSIARGGVAVLSDIDLDVAPGRALILRGPNGVGKTTLLRTLAGLQPPLSGTISPDPECAAYASHADGLKATLTVEENLRFWARVHGHADIGTALDAFDLHRLAHRAAATLSAGQKRRLGLARMVVTRRPVWLLDEPTVSLDTAAVAQFADAVGGHLGAGGLAVIATHIDLGLADAEVLDVTPYRVSSTADRPARAVDAFDTDDGGAFL